MGANAETRIYTNRRKPMAGDAKGRLDSTGREEETLQTQTIRANARETWGKGFKMSQ